MDFKQAEKKFKRLKEQFETGALTENAFKAKLEELMVQDEGGDWWMIGYETEEWYRNDGADWVQADPPIRLSRELTRTPEWLAIFLIMLGWVIGGAIGGRIYWEMGEYVGTAVGGIIVGGLGSLVTMLVLRRGQILSRWKSIVWVTLAWALGGAIGWTVGEALTEASGAAVGGAISGAIGWGITSRIERGLSSWKSMLWITLAWAVGAIVGWTLAREIQSNIDGAIGWPVGAALIGGIGGFVLIWQLRKVEENDGFSAGGEKI
jgi:hypothetical protein